MTQEMDALSVQTIQKLAETIRDNVARVIVGKLDVIDLLLVALFSDGHILIEDVPGIGKTVMAKALARSLGATFQRVQGTPDLLPTDVTGVSYYDQRRNEFVFRQGPIFTQILLVDEVNRATPRTQSALLESMAERQVTVERNTMALPRPFLVIATQNPIELEGTFPLPEAQLDRFLLRVRCQERGFHTFGPVRLSSSDPFGWLECEATVPASETLMVYPLLAPLEALGLSSVHPLGENVLPRPFLEDPLRFAGVRDYVLGDDPRRIHWKATAHTGILESKIYEPPALRRLLILLDVWNYSDALKGPDAEIQELTIAAAASLSMWALDESYMVGLLVNCAIVTSPTKHSQMNQAIQQNDAGNNEHATPTEISSSVVSVPFASDHGQYERILSILARLVPQYSSSHDSSPYT